MTGDPSSELQQYLHRPGHPSVGMSMIWKGFFMQHFSVREGIFVFFCSAHVPERQAGNDRFLLPPKKRSAFF